MFPVQTREKRTFGSDSVQSVRIVPNTQQCDQNVVEIIRPEVPRFEQRREPTIQMPVIDNRQIKQ